MFVDKIFISRLSNKLERFTQKRDNLYNFKCPICGDSRKKSYKVRGFIYIRHNKFNFMCHNCGASMSLANFIKTVDQELYDEYVLDKWKEGQVGSRNNISAEEPTKTFKFEKPVFEKSCNFKYAPKISELDESHIAKKYCDDRKLPNQHLLYYTDKFGSLVAEITNNNNDYDNLLDDERIVIPFFDEKCNLIALQGRAIGDSPMRYITVKVVEDAPKIYGLERVDTNRTVYVVEGPLDSLFLDNCIAVAGSDLNNEYTKNFSDVVFVYDNEPRNLEIVKKIQKTITNNNKVVIWPDKLKEKDINDIIMSGIDTFELKEIISKNTLSGLAATLRLGSWKRR